MDLDDDDLGAVPGAAPPHSARHPCRLLPELAVGPEVDEDLCTGVGHLTLKIWVLNFLGQLKYYTKKTPITALAIHVQGRESSSLIATVPVYTGLCR